MCGGRVPSPRASGFGLVSHVHIVAASRTDTTTATAPMRDGSRGFREWGGRGRAVQQRSLSAAVLGSRPRSAYTLEVGGYDVIASQVSQMRLELLHLCVAVLKRGEIWFRKQAC